ncbi:hypothetical protein HY218_01190 [Candidatus Saccharibacteria bacterium]|nr:hypothetical protein [Candidatus Saccharibacteria bacterium]
MEFVDSFLGRPKAVIVPEVSRSFMQPKAGTLNRLIDAQPEELPHDERIHAALEEFKEDLVARVALKKAIRQVRGISSKL